MKKIAFITGASRGIGAACAMYFAHHGYDIAVNYLNNKVSADDLVEKIKSTGQNAIAIKSDVSDRTQVSLAVKECKEKLGDITVLINNAGIAEQKLFSDITPDDWRKMFSVNVDGVYNTTSEILPDMIRKKSGSIVNISSMWGVVGASCEVHYSASKSAVIGLTKALAKEVAPSGIRVNCVAPGLIETDMNKAFTEDEISSIIDEIPLGKIGKPEDVAKAVFFLADDDASPFTTGVVLNVNGGMVI